MLGGTVGDPVSSALPVFTGAGSAAAFARVDPYVEQGLVRHWSAAPWNTVVGTARAEPAAGVRNADVGRLLAEVIERHGFAVPSGSGVARSGLSDVAADILAAARQPVAAA